MKKFKIIRVELSSRCQLKCPSCPKVIGYYDDIGEGVMSLRHFKKIVEKNPSIKCIEVSNFGEIFLNPDIDEILEYSYMKKIKLTALNGVNLNFIKDSTLEKLVKYKFRKLSVSIDGADQETYSIYRKGGDFNKVIRNIEKLNYYKNKYNSKYPKLHWQYILFGHNQNQLQLAKKYAKKLNMKFKIIENFDKSYSSIDYVEPKHKSNKLKDFFSKFNFNIHTSEKTLCSQMWYMPQINWDGRLMGCCVNTWEGYGNVLESSLAECINSEKFRSSKRLLLNRQVGNITTPCSVCYNYQKLKPIDKLTFNISIIFYKFWYFLYPKFSTT